MSDVPGLTGFLLGLVIASTSWWPIYAGVRPFLASRVTAASTKRVATVIGGLPAYWIGGPVVANKNPLLPLQLSQTDQLTYLIVIVVLDVSVIAAISLAALVPDIVGLLRGFRQR